MLASIEPSIDPSFKELDGSQKRQPGPLFKDIYKNLVDLEDPSAWGPILAEETKSFLTHTTDIQTLGQFLSIHKMAEKLGTNFHHKIFLKTLAALSFSDFS